MGGYIRIYEGSIEDVLYSGEHDSGDGVLIDYDELFDLIEQVRIYRNYDGAKGGAGLPSDVVEHIERRSNRPLHPCLGGRSPYSEFLPL